MTALILTGFSGVGGEVLHAVGDANYNHVTGERYYLRRCYKGRGSVHYAEAVRERPVSEVTCRSCAKILRNETAQT